MPIYLVRHAEAVDESHELVDESRYLTARGREDARALGVTLARHGIVPSAVVASPLVRAVQTAELLVSTLAPGLGVSIHEGLAPGASRTRRLRGDLAELDGAILVGHEPGISALAAELTGQLSFPAFHKGQATTIDDGRASFWLMPGDARVRSFER